MRDVIGKNSNGTKKKKKFKLKIRKIQFKKNKQGHLNTTMSETVENRAKKRFLRGVC